MMVAPKLLLCISTPAPPPEPPPAPPPTSEVPERVDSPFPVATAIISAVSVLIMRALIATDAPLLPGQCAALARRVPLGLARTGTTGSHFSGDLFLALSVANRGAFEIGFPRDGAGGRGSLEFVQWNQVDLLHAAVVQAVEEAVVNALTANEEMTGRLGHRTPAMPRDRVRHLLGV